jgi:hypothetical protein
LVNCREAEFPADTGGRDAARLQPTEGNTNGMIVLADFDDVVVVLVALAGDVMARVSRIERPSRATSARESE